MKPRTAVVTTCLLYLSLAPAPAGAADDATPGELRSYTNVHTIGVEWDLVGDDDHDATASVRYRFEGASAWRDALPLVRVAAYGQNMLAGSVLFLEPGTVYVVELSFDDPDGGSATETLTLTTRRVPQPPASGRTLHVAPGSGGGSGTAGDPFLGIAAAQADVQAGDTFLVHAGDYGSGEALFDSGGAPGTYVVWRAAGDGVANFSGGIRVDADHLWLEGLTVDNGPEYALLVYDAPDDVVIARCTFTNSHYAIDINHGGSNWHIVDNTIYGDTDPASESFSGEGVELQNTSGHVVAYNSITWVADGASYPGTNCDFYGNDIFDTSDDGIETDQGYANVRVWRNRLHNVGHNGFTFQPQNGAPWYFLRNQLSGYREDALKFREGADRFMFAHNTVVNWAGVFNNDASGMAYGISRNNLFVSVNGGRMWDIRVPTDWRTDLDYDGFDWGGDAYPFKYDGTNMPDLDAFRTATGQEAHGIAIDRTACFESLDVPGPPPTSIPPQYMTLAATGCAAVNAGQVMANVSDDYSGAAPDLGAYEVGDPLPHYGPRTRDDGPPTAPTDLAANPDSDTQVHLTWTAATDDIGVVGYRVFRDGLRVGTATGLAYTDTGLAAETTYQYEVSAYDGYWYESPRSAPASATTLAAGETVDAGIGSDGSSDGGGNGADDASSGCGCRGGRSGGAASAFLVLLAGMCLRRPRRARRG